MDQFALISTDEERERKEKINSKKKIKEFWDSIQLFKVVFLHIIEVLK